MDLLSAPDLSSANRKLDIAEPFTPAMAARSGLGRAGLDRLVRDGQVVRLVRGVYVDAGAVLTSMTRARALALVLGRRHLVVGRTAAWVHGAPAMRPGPAAALPLDVEGRRTYPGGSVPVGPEEITLVGGIRCTSATRTSLDVARHLAPAHALPLLDGMLRAGAVTHGVLVAAAASASGLPGVDRARELAAIADGRAADVAESLLRLHWLGAQLPTPVPGWEVGRVRMALALPVQRFGAVLAGRIDGDERIRLRRAGWTTVVLDEHRVLAADPSAVGGHLEREFHRHLLDQMDAGRS